MVDICVCHGSRLADTNVRFRGGWDDHPPWCLNRGLRRKFLATQWRAVATPLDRGVIRQRRSKLGRHSIRATKAWGRDGFWDGFWDGLEYSWSISPPVAGWKINGWDPSIDGSLFMFRTWSHVLPDLSASLSTLQALDAFRRDDEGICGSEGTEGLKGSSVREESWMQNAYDCLKCTMDWANPFLSLPRFHIVMAYGWNGRDSDWKLPGSYPEWHILKLGSETTAPVEIWVARWISDGWTTEDVLQHPGRFHEGATGLGGWVGWPLVTIPVGFLKKEILARYTV